MASSLPARSSAASSSEPPICSPSMKICGTVVRPLARCDHLVAPRRCPRRRRCRRRRRPCARAAPWPARNSRRTSSCRSRPRPSLAHLPRSIAVQRAIAPDHAPVAQRPRQGQHVDRGRAGALQHPGAFLDRGAGGQHIVDQHDPLARDVAAAAAARRRRRRCARAPGGALALRRRAAAAHQPIGADRRPARARGSHGPAPPPGCSGARKAGSNAAAPAPAGRHRPEARRRRAASSARSAGARWGRSPCLRARIRRRLFLVIAQRRARAVEGRPPARASAAQRVRRRPDGRTAGRSRRSTAAEKGDAAPAPAAQRSRLARPSRRRQAARRQHGVEQAAADPPQSA